MNKFEEVSQKLSEVIDTMSKKEKDLYIKKGSLQETVTYKIICNSDTEYNFENLEREFSDLILLTKENDNYNWYFSNLKEEEIEKVTVQINKFASEKKEEETKTTEEDEVSEEERKRLEEEARIEEERRKQEEKEREELERELKIIMDNKLLVRELKEVCEDLEQLTYVLKNQVNFMTFYYLVSREKEIDYNNYSLVFDWYMDLSQKYVRVKQIEPEYDEVSKESFKKQLEKAKEIYDLLYRAWGIFKAEKKIPEKCLGKVKKKVPQKLLENIYVMDIFGFRKEFEL